MRYFIRNFILLIGIASLFSSLQAQGFLSQRLQSKIATAGTNDYLRVLVSMKEQADISTLHQHLYDINATPELRSYQVITTLQNTATRTQKNILDALTMAKGNGDVANVESFWVVNLILVEAKKGFIQQLVQREDVGYIDLDGELKKDAVKEEKKITSIMSPKSVGGVEPGLCKINVAPLWKMGYTGCGRIMMNIDEGVDNTHPALSGRYRGNFVPNSQAWLDPQGGTTSPSNCGNHGTHVMGIMGGLDPATNDTIGVAIGAQWMAAKTLCTSPHTSYSIQAFQWAMNPDGNASTVSDRPDVINNSWYDPNVGACDVTYQNLFINVEAAGIAIVFSAGNAGSGASTITNPKSINVSLTNTFTVAAVDAYSCSITPSVASFSSRGPSACGGTGSLLIKPEVSAPGVSVRSADLGGGYTYMSGTSMAAPHVSGAIALLKEAFPTLTGEQIKLALYNSCTDLGTVGEDNDYGKGLINVYAAYQYLMTNYGYYAHTPCNLGCGGLSYSLGCSNTITDGSTTKFNYNNYSNCKWWIAASDGPITLTFDSLDIEYGYDYIYVYDGVDSTAPLLATITGNTIPAPIISSNWDMFVKFTSDYVVTKKGFQAKWNAKAGKPVITGTASSCIGTAGVLTANAVSHFTPTYSWNTGSLSNPLLATATGSYTVTATNTCGTGPASNPFTYTVNSLPKADAGLDKTICNGSSTTIGMTAVAGVMYSWSPSTGLSSNAVSNPTAKPTTTTNYILTSINTSTGCYRKDTVKVTVLAAPTTATAGVDKTICQGLSTTIGTTALAGTTYSWTPTTGLSSSIISNPVANPTATTNYIMTATLTATGCTKLDTVKVTVNNYPSVVAGPDKSICSGTSTVIGSTLGTAGATYAWSPTTALSSSTVTGPTASPTTTTTYIVTGNNAGCIKRDTVIVTVLPLPTANAGLDKTICSGASTTIGTAAIAGNTYTWSPTLGLSASNIAVPTVTRTSTVVSTTNYTVTVTGANGCTRSDAMILTVNPLPAVSAGVDKAVCAGSSTTIGGIGVVGQTYLWSPTTGLSSSTSSNPTATPTATTSYIVTATLNGCTKRDTAKVTVNALPSALAGADKSVCLGSSTTIGQSTVAGVTYAWTPSTYLNSSVVSNPTVTPTATGSVTYIMTSTVTATGCQKRDTVVVTTNVLPTANAGVDQTICSGACVTIGSTAALFSSYAWTPATGLSSTTVANPTACPTVTTNYILTRTATLTGCSRKDTVKITVNPLPTANAGLDKTITAGGSTTIGTAAVAGNTYSWSPPTALNNTLIAVPTASPTTTTTYTLTVTNTTTGCAKQDQVIVTVNGITPSVPPAGNGDNSINSLTVDAPNFNVYPNPVGDELNIVSDVNLTGTVKIQLYNELGQVVFEKVVDTDHEKLDLKLNTAQIASGIYSLKIESSQAKSTQKIVKE